MFPKRLMAQAESRLQSLPFADTVGLRALSVRQFVYERSGGRIGHRFGGVRNLLLHTVGAKTGQARTNALTYARDGNAYVIVASLGGAPRSPGWYHNLRANPDAEIHVGPKKLAVHARVVGAGDPDRERLWALADRNNSGRYGAYQRRTERVIPIVVLEPR